MKKTLSLLLIIFLAISAYSQTQNYPVQASVEILPPYPVHLSDYVSAVKDKMFVNLHLKDVTQDQIEVRLKFTIKSDEVTIVSHDNFSGMPTYTLGGGEFRRLSGIDFAPYLNRNNITYQGAGQENFYTTGRLPENVYHFMVEAFVVSRDAKVSNTGVAVAWLRLFDPPQWTSPFVFSQADNMLEATFPQNILFSWMPGPAVSDNPAFSTEYELHIVETEDQQTPEDAVANEAYANFSYRMQTSGISLMYGPAEPQLTVGKTYACQIRAYDTEGRDLYKNQGKSIVLSFTFGRECNPVNLLPVDDKKIGTHDAMLVWQPDAMHTGFVAQYREKTEHGMNQWFVNETENSETKAIQLKPGTLYEYRVQPVCGSLPGEFSETDTFRTRKPEKKIRECGQDEESGFDPESPLLQTLNVGDEITVGGFEATVREVSGSGTFTGVCDVFVPAFGIDIRSEFVNISVNEKREVVSGEINAIREKIDYKSMGDTKAETWGDDLQVSIEEIFNNPENYLNTLDQLYGDAKRDPYIPAYKVDNLAEARQKLEDVLTQNTNGTGPVKLTDTQVEAIEKRIDDIEKLESDFDKVAKQIERIDFSEHADQYYGFDAFQHEALRGFYSVIQVNGSEYMVPWKSAETLKTDRLIANYVTTGGIPPKAGVTYTSNLGATPLATPDGSDVNKQEITITGKAPLTEEEITATITKTDDNGQKQEVLLGQFNLKSYEKVQKTLVIVPVKIKKRDGSSTDPLILSATSVKEGLDKIYQQAVASWAVETANVFTIDITKFDADSDNLLDCETSDLRAYTSEMQAVINAYDNDNSVSNRKYYIFLMPGSLQSGAERSRSGMMPLGRRFGFVFDGSINTIAHEIGHGAFSLRHTFSNFNYGGIPKIAEGTTDNLMDYPAGTKLYKHQWDLIHDPTDIVIGGGGEDEGAILTKDYLELIYVDDSIVFNKDIVINANKSRKVYIEFVLKTELQVELDGATLKKILDSDKSLLDKINEARSIESVNDSTIKEPQVDISYRQKHNKNKIIRTIKKQNSISTHIPLNKKIEFNLDSVPDGKYETPRSRRFAIGA